MTDFILLFIVLVTYWIMIDTTVREFCLEKFDSKSVAIFFISLLQGWSVLLFTLHVDLAFVWAISYTALRWGYRKKVYSLCIMRYVSILMLGYVAAVSSIFATLKI